MRAASIAAWKQSDGVLAATTGSGDSPCRPYSAISRSAASVLVGMPVEGPARWMSTTTSGSSIATASPIVSAFRSMPGPLVAVTARRPGEGGAERHVGGGDLVLGLDRVHAEACGGATARAAAPTPGVIG